MSINLALTLVADENAREKLQNLKSGNFLEIWKNSEIILQDPPTRDALLRSVASFRDKVLEIEKNGKLEISDLHKIIAELKKSPHTEVAEYWQAFAIPSTGKFVQISDIAEAVREFLATPESDCSEFSGASETRDVPGPASVLPLLLEIREDVKAVKENRKSQPIASARSGGVCSDVFGSLNSCFMQFPCFV